MATQNIQQVGGVRDRSDMSGVDQPGAFTVFNDNSAIFTGDGSITFQGATGHFVGYLAKQDPAMARLAQVAMAAELGARLVLQQNPGFAGQKPSDVVPRGAQVNMQGDSLKALLKPFATEEGIKKLQSALETMSFEGGGGASRVTGQVRSKGLGLPSDPRI